MMVLHHSICTVEIASMRMPRNCVYLTVFNTIMSLNWCWGGEVRRTSIHIKKSSNLPDDKNDFPYVLFLIKELLFFIDTKCVIYLLFC